MTELATGPFNLEDTWERITELNARQDAIHSQTEVVATSLRVRQDALLDAVSRLQDENKELYDALEGVLVMTNAVPDYLGRPERVHALEVYRKHSSAPRRGETTIWRKSLPLIEKAMDSLVNGWELTEEEAEKARQLWLWVRSLIRS